MKRIVLGCLMLTLGLSASAEKTYKYRVNLKDKAGTLYSIENPQAFLSERAIERRNRQQLPVDETDLPVSQQYVRELLGTGARLLFHSSVACCARAAVLSCNHSNVAAFEYAAEP